VRVAQRVARAWGTAELPGARLHRSDWAGGGENFFDYRFFDCGLFDYDFVDYGRGFVSRGWNSSTANFCRRFVDGDSEMDSTARNFFRAGAGWEADSISARSAFNVASSVVRACIFSKAAVACSGMPCSR